ncbi:phosphotransferase [Streptomyces sp. NPDC050625]|uniref:phosphotransferase enzyme family protein n=1 Tax=Streptomyces sp. NPDC050625 TaxID=3154629 RepID=UPI00341A66F1
MRTTPGHHILDAHSADTACRLVRLSDWLISEGVATPAILVRTDGGRVGNHARRPVIATDFVGGRHPVPSNRHAYATGAALAQIHRLDPPRDLCLPSRRLPADWRGTYDVAGGAQLRELLEEAEAAFAALPARKRSFIHGDLFPDNMLEDKDGVIHLLDWETAAFDWPALDLGFAAIGLAGSRQLAPRMTDALLTGYSSASGRVTDDELLTAAHYACAVLMFHRFRHGIGGHPTTPGDGWRALLPAWQSLRMPVASAQLEVRR